MTTMATNWVLLFPSLRENYQDTRQSSLDKQEPRQTNGARRGERRGGGGGKGKEREGEAARHRRTKTVINKYDSKKGAAIDQAGDMFPALI